jgi:hypothetical protein
VADHIVAQLKERGDPWRLNEEAPTAGPPCDGGDGVPRGVPNVAKLAWVHVTRHYQFAYSRYKSVLMRPFESRCARFLSMPAAAIAFG